MPKNFGVLDPKPKNSLVSNRLPNNNLVIDAKPKMLNMVQSITGNRVYERTLGAGASVGPGWFMFITYPIDITIVSPNENF